MKYFSTTLLALAIAVLLCWQLPWCYNFFFAKSGRPPFTLYSCVIGDFAMMEHQEGKGMTYRDASGRTYTQAEFDSILPMFYARQLMADERFPDTLNGVHITPRMVQTENFTFRTDPASVNTPVIGLYPLFETMSGRVELEQPEDVFRITDRGMEFMVMQTNRVDEEKSRLFTEAMQKKGFRFPALDIAGNPTVKKEYDEGYLLLDAEHRLYHLKQTKGRPFVRAVELPEGLRLEKLYITEFGNRKTLGFLIDSHHALYVLRSRTYEIVKTGIDSFNPRIDQLTIMGNMFDWTIRVTSADRTKCYAVRADDYSLIKTIEHKIERKRMPGLVFTSPSDKLVKPRFE